MSVLSDNYKMLGSTIRSVVCSGFGRLPIPPEYLPDPPILLHLGCRPMTELLIPVTRLTEHMELLGRVG
jgi:hypothetical protein